MAGDSFAGRRVTKAFFYVGLLPKKKEAPCVYGHNADTTLCVGSVSC